MSTEAQPKRESYTGWIIGVGLLLLLAAAIPIGLKLYGPREMVMDLQGDPGGKIVWRHNGPIDPAATRAAIVTAMTPYYQPPQPASK